jgi:hypothetical protein
VQLTRVDPRELRWTELEVQCASELAKHAALQRVQLMLTDQLTAQLERLDRYGARLSPEIVDALRERAFDEFSAAMDRVSRIIAGEGPR